MATDVRLDEGDGTFLVLDARVVKADASDFMLDSAQRRKGGGPFRRALVHNENDGLTVNLNGDYPGGVAMDGVVTITSTLVVRGDISFGMPGVTNVVPTPGIPGPTKLIPASLNEQLKDLQSQISELNAKVAALQAQIGK